MSSLTSATAAGGGPRKGRRRRARWGELGERQLAWLLLAPAFLLLGFVVVYPIFRLVRNSFFDLRLQAGEGARFVGWGNYGLALEDPEFWGVTGNAFLMTLITVPGALVVGLGLALLADLPFRHRWLIRLGLLLPWALPLSFAGLIAAWFFHSDYGLINDLLSRVSPGAAQSWLLRPNWAFAAVCLTIIWKASSFVALVLLAGLQTIPKDLYEAATMDGASPWRRFWAVVLPLLMPAILVAMIFRTISAIQTFDIPAVMTRGGPGHATETLAMLTHKTTIEYLDVGYGSTLAVLMFMISLLVIIPYLTRIGRER